MVKNRFLIWVFRILMILLFLIVLLVGAAKIFEKKIVQQALIELNKEIKVPVYVDEVNFSLLKKFPYATIHFKNLKVLSPTYFRRHDFKNTNTDTLLFIGNLYMTFNLSGMRRDRIELTGAYASDLYLNLLVDSRGSSNYEIFNQGKTKESNTSGSVSFLIELVEFKNARIHYNNLYKKVSSKVFIPEYKLKGQFYKEQYSIKTTGSILLEELNQGILTFNPKSPANVKMDIDMDNSKLTIKKARLKTAGLEFQMSGSIDFGNSNKLDLKISGDNIDFQKSNQWIKHEKLDQYSLSGELDFKAIIKGEVGEKISPHIAVNYGISKAGLQNKRTNAQINNLSCVGKFSNGAQRNATSSIIELKDLNFTFGKSSFQGSVIISNLLKPNIDLNSKVSILTDDLIGFLPEGSGLKNTGSIIGQLSSQGQLSFDSSYTHLLFKQLNHSGSFVLKNLTYESTDKWFRFSGLNATLEATNNALNIKNFETNIQNTTCSGEATIQNLFVLFFTSKEKLKVVADLKLGDLNYTDLGFLFTSDTSETEYEMDFYAQITANSYSQESFRATQVRGGIHYCQSVIDVPELNFQSNEGQVSAAVNYNFTDNRISKLAIAGNITKANVNQLFKSFHNFGQEFITDKNIYGLMSTNFRMNMDYINGNPNAASLEYEGHIKLESGKLLNFEPIKQLATFSEVSELENIHFSTLENDLFIGQDTIKIPRMDINSNAFDIVMSGEHQFSGDYEYHLAINLSDLIAGKTKRLAKQQTEFGTIASEDTEGAKLYLVVRNSKGEFKVGFDKIAIKESMKSEVKEEKKEFKKALYNEFGWFKKDSTITKQDSVKTKKADFKIEWDEE